MPKVSALMSSIQAGEDTELELKEVVFRGDRVLFASEEGRAAPKLTEVFVSMANTSYQPVRCAATSSSPASCGTTRVP